VKRRGQGADVGDMDPVDLRAAQLAVNSAEQRHALLQACEELLGSEEHASVQVRSERGLDPCSGERRRREAVALEAQLDEGRSTVAVGLGIAGRVGGSLAELIETELRERVRSAEVTPAGVKTRRAAALMWTLVALEAEVEREILPAHAGGLEPARFSPQR
jgi:hypothetical protein